MIHVFAGTLREFAAYLDARGIDPNDARCVSRPQNLLGLRVGTEVVCTGTFVDHAHYQSIMRMIYDHGYIVRIDNPCRVLAGE
jgi:hypothetical protein